VRLRLFGVALAMAVFPASAAADSVIFMGPGGTATVRNDPFLATLPLTPAPARSTVAAARATRKRKKSVVSELRRIYRAGAITAAEQHAYKSAWSQAQGTARRLRGTRHAELVAVIQNLSDMAARGIITSTRLPALFLTLQRNTQYWRSGPQLSSGQRIEFSGSQLVWQYYPGQGIELTMLGNFGKADGLYTAGRSQYTTMQELLGELIGLAARRGGELTWEYYFNFDGGRPPWTSAMSQGTAIEALTRAYQALQKPRSGLQYVDYLGLAHDALGIFTRRPKLGVAVPTTLGTRYLQYSFAPSPSSDIINAFLQSLIGLYDYAHVSGDPLAARLFAAGDAEAQAEVPRFDTGAWSLYQPGQEDDLSYHELVTGFLQQLCSRTTAAVYCTTADHFQTYLKTPPVLSVLTRRARTHRRFALRFRLSKVSHVGVVLLRGTRTLFSTSASFPYGLHSFSLPAPKRPGTYTVRLAATDLAGNFARVATTLSVRR
jgi:hypothetical protein